MRFPTGDVLEELREMAVERIPTGSSLPTLLLMMHAIASNGELQAELIRKLETRETREHEAPQQDAEIARLRTIEQAAYAVAQKGWGTSVSEMEHFSRMRVMEALRAALAAAPDCESAEV